MIINKFKQWRSLASVGLLLAVLVSVSLPGNAAAQPPMPPGFTTSQTHNFYGLVTINTGMAPAGITITSYVNGTANATTTTDSLGRYGYGTLFYVSGNGGDTVTFKVAGVSVSQAPLSFQVGGVTRLDLSTVTTTLAVGTGAATNVGSVSATLNGTLADMGGNSSVSVSFHFGTTTAYGGTSAPQTLSAPGSFSVALTGLTPSTIYHCRAVATGGIVTVYGADVVFTTTAQALSVSTSAATGAGSSGATLNGNLNDIGTNTTVNVYFQYGLTTGYGSTTPLQTRTSAGAISAVLTGLSGNQTYHFRAIAVGSTTVYGTDMTFVTTMGTLTVATGNADALTCNSARLNGNLTDLGASSSASVYFQWGLTTSYGSNTTAMTRSYAGTYTADLNGLQASTTYHFRAVAVGGTTVYGANVSVTTPSCSGGSQGPVSQYYGRVYLNGVPAAAGTTISAMVNGIPSNSTPTDANGRYGYSQLFYVTGNSGDSVTFTVGGTLVPQTATWNSGIITNIDLFVSYGVLGVSTGSAAYVSATSANFNGTLVGLGTDTSALVSIDYGPTTSYGYSTTPQTLAAPGLFTGTATGLTIGTTYHYRAKAIGSLGGTVYGNDATYVFTNTLSVATNAATSITSSSAVINGYLNSLGSDTSATVNFYWGTSSPPTTLIAGSPASLTAAGAFTANLTSLTSGQTYYFKARAVGSPSATTVEGSVVSFTAGGGGSFSVTTNAATVTGTTTATLNGTLNSLGSNSSANVKFFWGTTSSPSTEIAGSPASLTVPGSFTAYLSTLTSGQTYYYKAVAVGSTTVEGSVVSFVATPPVPGTGRLVGVDAALSTATTPLPANMFTMGQFIAYYDGTVTTFKINCVSSGNVKVAMYGADVSGLPTTLLGQATQAVSAGWNSITFPGTPVSRGGIYWLAGIADSAIIVLSNSYTYGGRLEGAPVTYSSFTFPSPYDSSLHQVYQHPMFAGWAATP